MAIKLLEGLHLTATNKRHIAHILANGWRVGQAARLHYALEPEPGQPGQWRYTITRREKDDWGRWQMRKSRGLLQAS